MTKLSRMQDADLKDKLVLVRVDHNSVKKGKIKDAMRIDATIPTLFNIVKMGGKPILMTHVGRPYDKKTGILSVKEDESVQAIVDYLSHKLQIKIGMPSFPITEDKGIEHLTMDAIKPYLVDLKNGKYDMLYLPNTRWFWGEEKKTEEKDILGKELSAIADVYINDAFGSWQPHVSTTEPAKLLPSYAGLLMQKEVDHLAAIFEPERPFVGIVAGSKFDTKIGPLSSLLNRVDHLVLGGVIYNAYLAVKYGLTIEGIAEDDLIAAKQFVDQCAKNPGKLVELPFVVESDTLDGKIEGKYRTVDVRTLPQNTKLGYVLDIDPKSFLESDVQKVFMEAKGFFINAVMGFTPNFGDGTASMYTLIDSNKGAMKMFGGGDTLQDFKLLLTDTYLKALDDPRYYFFTGGGAVLTAIEQGSAYGMEPVKLLLKS